MKRLSIQLFIMLLSVYTLTAQENLTSKWQKTNDAVLLKSEFPFLYKLLTAEKPWEMEPREFVKSFFTKMPRMTQGSNEYPLHYTDQRTKDWVGEQVFEQVSYETEYYCFDQVNPVVKLHIGRPIISSRQMGRVDEVAKGRLSANLFPYLNPTEITPLLEKLYAISDMLKEFGAKEVEKEDHYLVRTFKLPNGTTMTVTNLSGSTNGSPYVEITLTPTHPVVKYEGWQTVAFPGAEGFGRYARGGRGGKVYIITSLEDYLPHGRSGRTEGQWGQPSTNALTLGEGNYRPYVDPLGNLVPNVGQPLLPSYASYPPENIIPGTLREAIEAKGPRIIVFAVSGDINLKKDLVISNPYCTIAGQTAPGEGIQLRNWGLKIDAHDVIVRNLRIRVGERKGPEEEKRTFGEQTHALDVCAMNVIVDHCEMAYANDQIFNFYGQRNRLASTVQWSYIYGAPTNSTHEKGDHSMSMAANGWGYASFHHNLIAHGSRRNPRLDTSVFDYRNNTLYNHGGSSGYGSDNDYLRLNYICSTIKRGPNSAKADSRAFSESKTYGQFYAEGNNLPQSKEISDFGVPQQNIKKTPNKVAPVTTHLAKEAYELVLSNGGVNVPTRDAITRYVSQTVKEGTGLIPKTAEESWPMGGYPTYKPAKSPKDTSKDGMPDKWKKENGLDPKKYQANGRNLDKDYDNIELYINSLTK